MVQYSVRSLRRLSVSGLARPVRPLAAIARATAAPTDGVVHTRTLLSPRVFRAVWWCVCGFHVFCGAFSLALGGVHALLATPELFEYTSTSLQTPLVMLYSGACAFLWLGCVHLWILARMVLRSIQQGQLSFVRLRERKSERRSRSHAASWRRLQRSVIAERRRRRRSSLLLVLTAAPRGLRRVWRRYFSIDGLFGLHGEHFDTTFTAREILEMLSQLYQTYLLSVSVVTPWVNQFAVAVVIVNSVSGLAIRAACTATGARVSTRHLLTLVVDVALDFCSSMLIPVCILYQVVHEFDWTTMTIPLAFLNSDAWLARRIAEVHQLIITSALDLVSMLALHIGVLGAMLAIASDLRREQGHHRHIHAIAVVPHPSSTNVRPVSPANQPSLKATRRQCHDRRRRGRWLLDLLFLASGVSALAAHLRFQRDSAEAPFCVVHVNAWFVRKFPCAVLRVNCHRLGAGGGSVAAVLAALDETVLVSVSFAHCVAPVEVPVTLTAFHAVRQLKFINVSAIAWAPGVEINAAHFPRLSYVLFGRTNMSGVPSALLHDRLPRPLREIEWSHSNLSALPADIGRVWAAHEWFSIVLDHTQLAALPASFALVRCRQLSLVDAPRLDTLSEDDNNFRFSPSLRKLVLSGSPIASLPPSLTSLHALEQVLTEHTRLSSVPTGLREWARGRQDALSLFGSPVCDEEEEGAATTTTPLTAEELHRWCATDHGSARGVTRWELLEPFMPV